MALDTSTAEFVIGVSKATKIDPRVLIAWVELEGANAPDGTGHFNYLNLRPEAGDVYAATSSGNFEQYANVNQAIVATVHRLQEPFARPIIATAAGKPTPQQQISAIASTGWDAGHYGGSGGINLQKKFASLFGMPGLTDSYVPPSSAPSVAATAGTGSAADIGSGGTGFASPSSVAGGANSIIRHVPGVAQAESIGSALSWLFSIKGAEVIGGAIIVILGITFLFKEQTAGIAQSFVGGHPGFSK
jgi:hypothetical protein